MKKEYFVYLLTNKNRSVLYIGVTSDLQRRTQEHALGLIPGFTKKYKIKHLLYYETYGEIVDAIDREKYLKKKTRKFKEDLISRENPEWKFIKIW